MQKWLFYLNDSKYILFFFATQYINRFSAIISDLMRFSADPYGDHTVGFLNTTRMSLFK